MLSTFPLVVLFSTAWASCPNGTEFQSCYNVNSQYLSFPAAEQACNKLGGNLVSPENMFETVYISGIAAASTSSFWIGANYLMDPQWTWTTGKPVVFTNWAPNQPNDPSIYECAAVGEQDNIKEQCNSRRPSVCQVVLDTSSSPFPPSSPSPFPSPTPITAACPANPVCSPGYTFYIGTCKCYKLFDSLLSFSDAQAFCAQENGVLPKIPDNSTNEFIISLAYKYVSFVWTGLICYDGRNSNSCRWQDGNQLGSFRPFNPSGSYPIYYLATYTRYNEYQWRGTHGDAVSIVCQKDPTITTALLEAMEFQSSLPDGVTS